MKKIGQGLGVSKGVIEGKVRIIENREDFAQFKGEILVTHLTDPTMVVLMSKAAGIICNIGGLTSHPSIVSREMGTPCIVSAKGIETNKKITETLREGMKIRMCGETGEIHEVQNGD
jgi:phosphoenolpyruvate synthase/pyruvate phosphate dikinase